MYAGDVKLPAGASGSEGIVEKASVGVSFSVAGDVSLEHVARTLDRESRSPTLGELAIALERRGE